MKPIFIFIFSIMLSVQAFSQVNPNEETCGIFFWYDGNGQRIHRMDDCVGGESHEDPGLEPPVVVYPNPTNGPFTVGLNEVVNLARMSLYTIDGVHLVSVEQTNVYELNYDIASFVPGSYLLRVYIRHEDESEDTHNFTLIKYSE